MGDRQPQTARAILQQEVASDLTRVLDARAPLICVEDAAMALGLALGAFVAINGSDDEVRQYLLARVHAVAQRAAEIGGAIRDARQ